MNNVNGQLDASPASPWLRRAQAATYAGKHPMTIWLALCEYRDTEGASGLKGYQRGGKGGYWDIHRDDLDRWVKGLPPHPIEDAA